MNDLQPVTITVDLKRFRIRIHRNTLALLGTPQYVQLLVSPTEMLFAIQGVEHKSRDCHRVNPATLATENSFELYSKAFVKTLCSLVADLDPGCSYRLSGNILSDENAVVFPLNTLQEIELWEGNE